MNKILKDPTYKSNVGYNGLDLSSIKSFSSSVGHVLPVSWDFLQPGDKVRLSAFLRTRTQPLISSAMAEIEENVRFFFVPINQIYKPFEQVFNGIQDYNSDFFSTAILGNQITDYIPRFSIQSLLNLLSQDIQSNNKSRFLYRCRLLECIGVPMQAILDQHFTGTSETSVFNYSFNAFPLLAYQKIWFDYFRDTDRIANDPLYYNMDSLVSSVSSEIGSSRLEKLLTLRNCPLIKDVVNNMQVSPVFGTQGIGGDKTDTLLKVNQWLTGNNVIGVSQSDTNNNTPQIDRSNPSTVGLLAGNNSSAYGYVYGSQLNPANLRSIFATEKLLEITRRTKKHYDAQILAHFGVKVPTGVEGECFEIGKHTQQIYIGDVISTAATSDARLGEVGGKGYGADNSQTFDFEAATHGVLMAVYYSRPKVSYMPYFIDKKLAYTHISDFPRPEFDDLGMQPVFGMNTNLNDDPVANSTILGWQYRYQEVKVDRDVTFGGLSRTLKSWVISHNGIYDVPSRFYCHPTAINQIMEYPYNENIVTDEDPYKSISETNKTMFDSDPLIHQLSLTYRKASKISTYGLNPL